MLSTELLRRVSRAAMSAVIAATLLSGCETMTLSLGKKIDYKSAGSVSALEVPPDLTTPTYDDRYQVSTASGVAAARAAGRSTELLPVSPDARVARSGSERWLVVKATQEAAWTTLREFWTKNGFVIAIEQPGLGIMETDWAENRADLPKDFLQRFTSKYISFGNDTYKRDKFRSRIERGTEPGTVEIFISHRGAAQLPTKFSQGAGEDWQWTVVPPNPELEAEFLERLMLAFGTPAPKAAEAVATMINAPDRSWLSTMHSTARGVASASRSIAPALPSSIVTVRKDCILSAIRIPTWLPGKKTTAGWRRRSPRCSSGRPNRSRSRNNIG